MVKYRCGHCGFEGHCYGVPTSKGVSAPFCARCGKNDKLTPLGNSDEVMRDCCIAKAKEIFGRMSLKDGDTSKMEKCNDCDFTVNVMIEVYDPEM